MIVGMEGVKNRVVITYIGGGRDGFGPRTFGDKLIHAKSCSSSDGLLEGAVAIEVEC